MNVLLVQGTWGDDDTWWRRSQVYPDGNGTFADAVVAAGHTLVNGRPFEWSTDLGGVGFGNRDLNTWKGAGRHLYDYCDPPRVGLGPIPNLCIIGHSHARQVIKYACSFGLAAETVLLVSGPIRKDVDRETTEARTHIGRLICYHGGAQDRMQWFGELFDGVVGVKRHDPEADDNRRIKSASHSTLLRDPAFYHLVLADIYP